MQQKKRTYARVDQMRRGGFPFPPFLLSLVDAGRVNLKNELARVTSAPNIYEAALNCMWWFGGDKSGMTEDEQAIAAQKLAAQARTYYKHSLSKYAGSKKARK